MTATGIEALVCQDIAKRQYGRWTLVEQVSFGKHEKWVAKCSCGTTKLVFLGNIKRGKSLSCGCMRAELTSKRSKTHGKSRGTAEYRTWAHIKGRCLNKDDAAYKDYGGRGIKICDRWLVFENFYLDMGQRPPHHSIERVDVNGNYEPANCIWLPKNLQARNTRATRFRQEEINKIRTQLEQGVKPGAIAKQYKTSRGHICQIRDGLIWK